MDVRSIPLHNLLRTDADIKEFKLDFRRRRNSSSKLFAYNAVIKHDFGEQINKLYT